MGKPIGYNPARLQRAASTPAKKVFSRQCSVKQIQCVPPVANKRSAVEPPIQKRHKDPSETTRPPKKVFFTIYHLDFFIRRCIVSSQEAGYIPSEQRIHWSLKTLSYVVKRLERLCFPASVFILKFFAFHPLISLDFSIRKGML